MNRSYSLVIILLSLFLIFNIFSANTICGCKDIIATGNATDGAFNLLLKVRDPSRPGLQVLTQIPKNYTYTYHHPWTGKSISFEVNHSYIGVTSQQDVPPNIVKSGMVLTSAGLAYGDADSLSRWVNPSPYAWDDFDWIRYSCEQASTESEAVTYLTTKAVDQLHATGVSENLCVVGPNSGYLIEADAYRHHVKKIDNGVDVISNYPRELWDTQIIGSRFIADAYDAIALEKVKQGDYVHLNGIARIKILQLNESSIKVRQLPFFTNIGYHDGKISLFMPPESIGVNEQKTIGDFYISVQHIENESATIHLSTAVYAWEQALLNRILPKKGNITVKEMIEWSRLQANDVNDVRAMCEAAYPYEGVAVYQIPNENYQILSKGWFSANHACSSIYVPFHCSNKKIYNPYETGKAAEISLLLYQNYSDNLLSMIQPVENIFIKENKFFDEWCVTTNQSKVVQAKVLNTIDLSMQKQAWIMQQLFYNVSKLSAEQQKTLFSYTESLWKENYTATLHSIANILNEIETDENNIVTEPAIRLMKLIPATYINILEEINISTENIYLLYENGEEYLNQYKYIEASELFQQIVQTCKKHFEE